MWTYKKLQLPFNPAWIRDFLLVRAGSHGKVSSINKLLMLGSKFLKADLCDAVRFLTKC